MPILRFLVALAALFAAAPAAAYWDYGHRAVATIAWKAMKPATRVQVRAILRNGALLDTPGCPVGTIEDASVWADCIKPLGDRFSYAGPWHYQNVDICKPFDLKSACKDGNCLSAQIERNARLVADKTTPGRERLQALAFLIHLLGDLSNPMHAGDRGDRGGNDVAANYGLIGGRTNLHSMWDGWIAERAITTPPGGARTLLAQIPTFERGGLAAGTVEDWSRQSWEAARTLAYTSLLGDPCGPLPKKRPTLTEQDVQGLIPPVRRQVVTGGLRLARLLDEALLEGKAPNQRPSRF